MQKAVIYCRVSSIKQSSEGHGLDSQEHRCREFARLKGHEVVKVFRDSFTGAGDFMDRPAMSSLLGFLDKDPINNYMVIFDDLKRLSRDTNFYLKLKREFSARKATVECPNFTFEETPEGQFIETIIAAQGELERKQNQRQVIQKMKARFEKGYWAVRAPLGYTRVKDQLHGLILKPKEPEASIIKEALEGFASGKKHSKVIGDDQEYIPTHIFDQFGYCNEIFLWGADYYRKYIPIGGSWMVWDKREGESADKGFGSNFELLWSKQNHKRYILRYKWFGFFTAGEKREYLHPTQKPVEMLSQVISPYCKENGLVIDLFLGSGSTLIASEKTGRICYGCELDEKYIDVIVQRWVDYMGIENIKLNGKEIIWKKTTK